MPMPATLMGSHSMGMEAGGGEPELPLTLWVCPRPGEEEEEEEEEEEAARGLHGASSRCAGASVAGGGRAGGSRGRTLLARAALPWQCQRRGAAPVANGAGAEVLGRARSGVFPRGMRWGGRGLGWGECQGN